MADEFTKLTLPDAIARILKMRKDTEYLENQRIDSTDDYGHYVSDQTTPD